MPVKAKKRKRKVPANSPAMAMKWFRTASGLVIFVSRFRKKSGWRRGAIYLQEAEEGDFVLLRAHCSCSHAWKYKAPRKVGRIVESVHPWFTGRGKSLGLGIPQRATKVGLGKRKGTVLQYYSICNTIYKYTRRKDMKRTKKRCAR